MSVREVQLDEVECHAVFLEEAVSCLLHTIIFLRNPKKITPEDCSCVLLEPLTYVRSGQTTAESDVRQAIDSLNSTLVSIGPNTSRGSLSLSYYEKREKSGFFGFTSMTEKVYFERWKVFFVVDHSAFSPGRDDAAEIARERARDSCRSQLQLRLLHVFQAVNQDLEHVPTDYEYEIEVHTAKQMMQVASHNRVGGSGSVRSGPVANNSSDRVSPYQQPLDGYSQHMPAPDVSGSNQFLPHSYGQQVPPGYSAGSAPSHLVSYPQSAVTGDGAGNRLRSVSGTDRS